MRVQTARTPHVIDDYDILTANGAVLPFSIDEASGDTIDFKSDPLAVIIHITEKTNPIDPEQKLPAQEITIYAQHIVSVIHTRREVMPPNPEQQFALKNLIQKLHPTIQ